jgi:hypothetical protein
MSRKKTTRNFIIAAVFVALLACAGLPAYADTLKAANVANLTTVTLMAVPAGQVFRATSMIVANANANPTCCARFFRTGVDVTGFVTVGGGDTVQVVFDPPIIFTTGDTVQVRNGASAGPLHFTVTGTREVK